MPLVSIVIPAYNSAEFIEATIRSIEAQTFNDYELLVSDHSSTDGTAEILQRFADEGRINLTSLESGGGAPANWRAVTAKASGKYIKLVCGDDLLAPTILEEQVAALEANPGAVMAASKRDLVDARGDRVLPARGLAGLKGLVPGRAAVRRSVLQGSNIFGEPGCVLMRLDRFSEAGGWTDDQPYVIDQFSYCRTLLLGDFVAVPKPLASFRVSAGQWSVALTKKQAEQVIGMHESLAAAYPGLLSMRDLAVGNTRARLMAHARRLTYVWLGRRMRARQRG